LIVPCRQSAVRRLNLAPSLIDIGDYHVWELHHGCRENGLEGKTLMISQFIVPRLLDLKSTFFG
jgi:hypothetical protein